MVAERNQGEKRGGVGNFPGEPVVKTLLSNARVPGFTSGQGTHVRSHVPCGMARTNKTPSSIY